MKKKKYFMIKVTHIKHKITKYNRVAHRCYSTQLFVFFLHAAIISLFFHSFCFNFFSFFVFHFYLANLVCVRVNIQYNRVLYVLVHPSTKAHTHTQKFKHRTHTHTHTGIILKYVISFMMTFHLQT